MQRVPWLAAAAIVSVTSGCAADGPRDTRSIPVANVPHAFENGEIRLACGLSCAAYYGGFRKQQRARYDSRQWASLAGDVARIGYEIDQAYFYLGRAAEGLGHSEAARTYYRLAIATPTKCKALFDVCDGLVFPDDALSRLRGLPAR